MRTTLVIATACALLFPASKASAETVTEAWVARYNGTGNSTDEAQSVALDPSGNVVVGGNSTGSGSGLDYFTAKYSGANGALLWSKRYNGPGNGGDFGQVVTTDSAGNVIVTGGSVGSGTGYDCYTAKYAAADGALLWEKRYNGTGNGTDNATGLAVDAAGNVIIIAQSAGAGTSTDYYTAKYAAANGALVWEKRYNGPANGLDFAQAVAVDSNGNVIVTGSSFAVGSPGDYYTAKYAAADGALLWEKRYNGTGNGGDRAHAVAIDSSNNVVVTGYSAGSGSSDDYYTAKYAAADGALVWEKRYNGPANFSDIASAVAIDGSGNVIVTGNSPGLVGSDDYYTAKYAAANGALIWEKRYNGTGNTTDYGAAVGVDGSGNVIVSGSSTGSATGFDFYTAKYAAANGALMWEARYNWTANGTEYLGAYRAFAVTPDGGAVVAGYSFNGTNNDYATVRYRAETPLGQWKLANLGDANAPDLGDPDGDGLSTLAEYGIAKLPQVPDAAPLTAARFIYPEGERLRVFITRDPAHNDVTILVEGGPDLQNGPWVAVASSILGAPFTGSGYVGGDSATPGLKTVEIRDLVNISSAQARFLRVRVTR